MNSADLSNFTSWKQWSGTIARRSPPSAGVYAFRMIGGQPLPRIKGQSDIVYIGSTRRGKRGIRQRLQQHLRVREGGVDTGYRLDRVLKEVGVLEIAWLCCPTHDDALWHEGELLSQ